MVIFGSQVGLYSFVTFLMGHQGPVSFPVCYLPFVFLWHFLISVKANIQLPSFTVSSFDFAFWKLFPVQKLYKNLHTCFLVFLLFLSFFKFHINVLNTGSANYDPWAKSDPLPIFVNKILLKHSPDHLFRYYLCSYQWLLQAAMGGMRSCNRGHLACKTQTISYPALLRKSLPTSTLILLEFILI